MTSCPRRRAAFSWTLACSPPQLTATAPRSRLHRRRRLVAALVGIGIALTLVGYYFVGIFWFQMVAIYEVKAESYHNSPIALSSAECDALTMEFIDVTGVELMSGPRLCQFVCQKFTAGRAQGKGKKDVPCVLAEGTTALLNAMATIATEEYVQSSLKKSKVKTALDSVLTEMESVSA